MTLWYSESLLFGSGGLMLAMTMSAYALPLSFSSRPPYFTIIPVKTRVIIGTLPYVSVKFPLDEAVNSLHQPCGETAEENLLRTRGRTSSTRAVCSPDAVQRVGSSILPPSHYHSHFRRSAAPARTTPYFLAFYALLRIARAYAHPGHHGGRNSQSQAQLSAKRTR